jgi:hypothetical protein|tara:strand:+ start:698 stop:886 length:189 start_codon:yes stop_codon:yes gene_type:complete
MLCRWKEDPMKHLTAFAIRESALALAAAATQKDERKIVPVVEGPGYRRAIHTDAPLATGSGQ